MVPPGGQRFANPSATAVLQDGWITSLTKSLDSPAKRIQEATENEGLGVLAITHFSRLLEVLEPDQVHVLAQGRIQVSGGPEIVERLEVEGYRGLLGEAAVKAEEEENLLPDPFADPLL